MTLNSIHCWGSSSGDLVSVEYPFVDITPMTTLILSDCTCWNSIYESEISLELWHVLKMIVKNKFLYHIQFETIINLIFI